MENMYIKFRKKVFRRSTAGSGRGWWISSTIGNNSEKMYTVKNKSAKI